MPKLKSAKKRLRQEIKRKTRNLKKKKLYKKIELQIKKTLQTAKAGNKIGKLIQEFYKAADKAAKAGAIHKNKASRKKANIMALVKKASGGAASQNFRLIKKSTAVKKTAKAKVRAAVKKKAKTRKAK